MHIPPELPPMHIPPELPPIDRVETWEVGAKGS